jgi:hypothetical protein
MFRLGMTALTFLFLASSAHAMDAMIELPSALPPHSSLDKPEAIAKARGMIVFVRIDHAAGARGIGQELRPTEVIIFGHPPKGNTPLLLCTQTYGIDLPMQVLAWDDAKAPAGWAKRTRRRSGIAFAMLDVTRRSSV